MITSISASLSSFLETVRDNRITQAGGKIITWLREDPITSIQSLVKQIYNSSSIPVLDRLEFKGKLIAGSATIIGVAAFIFFALHFSKNQPKKPPVDDKDPIDHLRKSEFAKLLPKYEKVPTQVMDEAIKIIFNYSETLTDWVVHNEKKLVFHWTKEEADQGIVWTLFVTYKDLIEPNIKELDECEKTSSQRADFSGEIEEETNKEQNIDKLLLNHRINDNTISPISVCYTLFSEQIECIKVDVIDSK